MKKKFNWGTGIFISIVLFMIFILSFVYKSLALKEYQHQLVSEDYYKDELHYQEDIDKLDNAKTLVNNIKLINTKNGIVVQFPDDFEFDKISGTINFQRPSNKDLDFNQNIAFENDVLLIKDSLLVEGKWNVKIDWKYKNQAYLFKDGWFY